MDMELNITYKNLSCHISQLEHNLESVETIREIFQSQQDLDTLKNTITSHFEKCIKAAEVRRDILVGLLVQLFHQQRQVIEGTLGTLKKSLHKCNETRRIGTLYYEDDIRAAEDFWQRALSSTQPIVDMDELTSKVHLSLPGHILDFIEEHGKVSDDLLVSIKRPSSSPSNHNANLSTTKLIQNNNATPDFHYASYSRFYNNSYSNPNAVSTTKPDSISATNDSTPSDHTVSITTPTVISISTPTSTSTPSTASTSASIPASVSASTPAEAFVLTHTNSTVPSTTLTSTSSSTPVHISAAVPTFSSNTTSTTTPSVSTSYNAYQVHIPSTRPSRTWLPTAAQAAAPYANASYLSINPPPPPAPPRGPSAAEILKANLKFIPESGIDKRKVERVGPKRSKSRPSTAFMPKSPKVPQVTPTRTVEHPWRADIVTTLELRGKPLFAEFHGIYFYRKDASLYICDQCNNQILKCSSQGQISVFARNVLDPRGIVAFEKENTFFVTNFSTHSITKITYEGNGNRGKQDGGGMNASFSGPEGIAIDQQSGNLFIADTANYMIRTVTQQGFVSTLAGSGNYDYADGTGKEARFTCISGMFFDQIGGCLLVCDRNNNCLRRVLVNGDVSYVLRVENPQSVVITSNRSILVSAQDCIYNAIPRSDGYHLELLAGRGETYLEKGKPTEIGFVALEGFVVDERSSTCWVAERLRIRVMKLLPPGNSRSSIKM